MFQWPPLILYLIHAFCCTPTINNFFPKCHQQVSAYKIQFCIVILIDVSVSINFTSVPTVLVQLHLQNRSFYNWHYQVAVYNCILYFNSVYCILHKFCSNNCRFGAFVLSQREMLTFQKIFYTVCSDVIIVQLPKCVMFYINSSGSANSLLLVQLYKFY